MSDPTPTRPALATAAVPGHVGAGAAAPQSQPAPASEKAGAAPAPKPPGESPDSPTPQQQGLGEWLGRHAVVAVLVLGATVYAGYELSTLFFAYTGDAYVDADACFEILHQAAISASAHHPQQKSSVILWAFDEPDRPTVRLFPRSRYARGPAFKKT
jgi:hypothetical protein